MNNLLKELELQAYIERESEWIDPSSNMPVMVKGREFSREKFAELIVKECASVQHKRFCEHGDVSWDILMEHFGVKE